MIEKEKIKNPLWFMAQSPFLLKMVGQGFRFWGMYSGTVTGRSYCLA